MPAVASGCHLASSTGGSPQERSGGQAGEEDERGEEGAGSGQCQGAGLGKARTVSCNILAVLRIFYCIFHFPILADPPIPAFQPCQYFSTINVKRRRIKSLNLEDATSDMKATI